MNKIFRYLIYFCISLPFSSRGQTRVDFYCGEQRHSYRFSVWSVPVQQCKGNKLYTKSVNFNDIPDKDEVVIESIYKQIEKRAGKELYDQLELYSITITPKPKGCNDYKYSFRYILRIDSVFYDRFTLTFDSEGKLKTKPEFPDIETNKNASNIIDYCSAISIAMNNREFKNACEDSGWKISTPNLSSGEMEPLLNISSIDLEYNLEKNMWTWILKSETKQTKDKGLIGKVIAINAELGEIMQVTDYSESKTVCFE